MLLKAMDLEGKTQPSFQLEALGKAFKQESRALAFNLKILNKCYQTGPTKMTAGDGWEHPITGKNIDYNGRKILHDITN